MIFRTIFCEKNEITCINVSSISIKKWKYYASRHTSTQFRNSLLRRGFCLKKKNAEKRERWKKGKGGKTGKAGKAREKGKSEESLCQISVEIWQKLSISDRTQPECRLSFS